MHGTTVVFRPKLGGQSWSMLGTMTSERHRHVSSPGQGWAGRRVRVSKGNENAEYQIVRKPRTR
jgi:hypothetical protein